MLSASVTLAPLLSRSNTVNTATVGVAGIPVITPVEPFRVNPAGKDPTLIDQA